MQLGVSLTATHLCMQSALYIVKAMHIKCMLSCTFVVLQRDWLELLLAVRL